MSFCKVLFLFFRGLFASRSKLILENLTLRHRLAVQQRMIERPKLKSEDIITKAALTQRVARLYKLQACPSRTTAKSYAVYTTSYPSHEQQNVNILRKFVVE